MEFCTEHSAHAQLLKRQDDRLTAHGKELNSLNVCIAKLTVIQEELTEWRHETDDRLTVLEREPAAKWNLVVTTVITSLITALISSTITALSILTF